MQRLYHDEPIPDELRGAVIALGNFDGFHLGHQAVVTRAIALGFHMRRPVIVATFDPHPVRHFKPDLPPFRLTTLGQRQEMFAHAGADAMLVFRFGVELAAMDAEEFVGNGFVVIEALHRARLYRRFVATAIQRWKCRTSPAMRH